MAQVGAAIAGVALVIMCLHIVADVTLRNLANRPLPSTSDYVAYVWMPTAALLGLGIAQLRDEQIRVTLLVDRASAATRRWVIAAGDLATGLIFALIAYLAYDKMIDAIEIQEVSTLGLPVWPVRILVFLAYVIYCISVVARIAQVLRDRGPVVDEIEALTKANSV